jgi:hypothetical protein
LTPLFRPPILPGADSNSYPSGTTFGLVLAFAIVRAFVAFGPADIPLLADARIDPTVLGFTVVTMLVAVALASLLPAWHAAKPEQTILLRQSATRVRGRGGGTLADVFHGRNDPKARAVLFPHPRDEPLQVRRAC